jgi:hypothetical protein
LPGFSYIYFAHPQTPDIDRVLPSAVRVRAQSGQIQMVIEV